MDLNCRSENPLKKLKDHSDLNIYCRAENALKKLKDHSDLSCRSENALKKLKDHSDLSCKVFSFLSSMTVAMSSWLMVVIAIEMYTLYRHPNTANKFVTG